MAVERKDSIAKPRPLPRVKRDRILYIPFDPPPRPLLAALRKKALSRIDLGWCALYLLADKAVLYGALGAPAAIMTLEMLVASGAKKVGLLSFCGSLTPRLRIGDVVSVTRAYADEGTSPHYYPRVRRFAADGQLKSEMEGLLDSLSIPHDEAEVVSTDAPFRETKSWLRGMQRKGIGAVDMEASAVFALSRFRGLQAAAIMIVSDELFSGTWNVSRYQPDFIKTVSDVFLPFL